MNQGGTHRADRVARTIQRLLAESLGSEIRDPRLKGVMFTHVRLTPDLQACKVWWYLVGGPDEDRVAVASAGFDAASKRIRALVAQKVRMKKAPLMTFLYDRGVDDEQRISALLHEAAGTSAAASAGDDDLSTEDAS